MSRHTAALAMAFASSLLVSCSATDGDYFPYTLTALDVWVYDGSKNANHLAGRIKANYFTKSQAVSSCAAQASAFASSLRLQNWGYVCCTVTFSSDCVTKVR